MPRSVSLDIIIVGKVDKTQQHKHVHPPIRPLEVCQGVSAKEMLRRECDAKE
jgi:hypothetical protein